MLMCVLEQDSYPNAARQLHKSLRSESQASRVIFGPSPSRVPSLSCLGPVKSESSHKSRSTLSSRVESSHKVMSSQVESSHKSVKSSRVESQKCRVKSSRVTSLSSRVESHLNRVNHRLSGEVKSQAIKT